MGGRALPKGCLQGWQTWDAEATTDITTLVCTLLQDRLWTSCQHFWRSCWLVHHKYQPEEGRNITRWQEGGRKGGGGGRRRRRTRREKGGTCKLCPTTLLYCACSRNAKSQKRHPICKKESKSTNRKWKTHLGAITHLVAALTNCSQLACMWRMWIEYGRLRI